MLRLDPQANRFSERLAKAWSRSEHGEPDTAVREVRLIDEVPRGTVTGRRVGKQAANQAEHFVRYPL